MPNTEVCIKLIDGAACAYTVEGPERDLTEEQFQRIPVGYFMMSPAAFGAYREFIQKTCANEDARCKVAKERLDFFVEEAVKAGVPREQFEVARKGKKKIPFDL